jgi:hypothetical protein
LFNCEMGTIYGIKYIDCHIPEISNHQVFNYNGSSYAFNLKAFVQCANTMHLRNVNYSKTETI